MNNRHSWYNNRLIKKYSDLSWTLYHVFRTGSKIYGVDLEIRIPGQIIISRHICQEFPTEDHAKKAASISFAGLFI